LNVLNSIGTDGSFGNEDSEKSVLSAASRVVTPAFAPLGIQEDNWPAVVGIFSGILAKEVVVGTLDNLYTALATEGAAGEEVPFDLWQQLRDAAATVPENLGAIGETLLDPLGLDIGDLSDVAAAAEEQAVTQGVFGAMVSRFDGQAGAFAYLLFVLLYFPCVATIGAIKREAGKPWAVFVATWTTVVAYITAASFYQIATYSEHPASSMTWLASLWVGFAVLLFVLRQWGQRSRAPKPQPARAEV